MKLTTITVNAGRTISTKQFEFARADVSYTAELEPGDDPAEVKQRLADMATSDVETTLVSMITPSEG